MSEELDQAVLDWLQEERSAGRVVHDKDLQRVGGREDTIQCWLSKRNK